MPRFAANLSMNFTEVPFLERFAAAARAGFSGVELLFPYAHREAEVAGAARAAGVEIVLFNLPPGSWDAGERGIAILPDRVEEFRDGVATAMRYAKALGTTRLHCMAGVRPAGVAEERLRATYVANVRFAAAEAARHGITLLVEAINTRDVPGYWLSGTAQAFALMDEIGAPNLRFQFDVYHVQIMEGDLAPKLEKHLARIGHVQIADTPGRHEPGSGEIHYPFLFRHLDGIGYAGWVGTEYKPAGATEAGLGWARGWLRPG